MITKQELQKEFGEHHKYASYCRESILSAMKTSSMVLIISMFLFNLFNRISNQQIKNEIKELQRIINASNGTTHK